MTIRGLKGQTSALRYQDPRRDKDCDAFLGPRLGSPPDEIQDRRTFAGRPNQKTHGDYYRFFGFDQGRGAFDLDGSFAGDESQLPRRTYAFVETLAANHSTRDRFGLPRRVWDFRDGKAAAEGSRPFNDDFGRPPPAGILCFFFLFTSLFFSDTGESEPRIASLIVNSLAPPSAAHTAVAAL